MLLTFVPTLRLLRIPSCSGGSSQPLAAYVAVTFTIYILRFSV